MRRPIIVGNWKMNMLISTADEWMRELLDKSHFADSVDIVVAPPFTTLAVLRERIKNSRIQLAGQNMGSELGGSQTGEISAAMLKDAGCEYVILGHSERRQYFAETDEIISKKIENIITFIRKMFIPKNTSKTQWKTEQNPAKRS